MSNAEEFARLAGRVANGRDKAAFARLFSHFAPRINAYLQKLGLPASQAEEMTQDVMAVLWHKADLFDPAKSSLSTWLFRIARNRRIDAIRRDRSHLLDPEDPMLQPEAPEQADEQLDAAERDERVRRALTVLPAEQAKLIEMAFFLGMTHTQISEQENLPMGTVKSRIRLAFNRLRKALEEEGPL
ncbi:RNA polymerase subunit sigma [Zhengella mangrovi]|uniref:RNA polymerase subunit sigma n=1 Tax=Zhengella mangrovi TaxID=1982044 RepID=A0A2G1QSQ8_9HYPH|nr:RNA polymerase subunit sigma [Zhengella mangrovi]